MAISLLVIGTILMVIELGVMWWGVKCSIQHDECTKLGSPERESGKWWQGIVMGTLMLFLASTLCVVVGGINGLNEIVNSHKTEDQLKCSTIDGEWSDHYKACYKDGVKIVFHEGEQVYGE